MQYDADSAICLSANIRELFSSASNGVQLLLRDIVLYDITYYHVIRGLSQFLTVLSETPNKSNAMLSEGCLYVQTR